MTESELQQLLLDPGRQVHARASLRDILDSAPRTMTYKQWLARLPAPAPTQPARAVQLLSSFTLETLEPFLQVEAYVSGWRAQTRYVQLGRWQNALVAPATAHEQPAATVLLLHDAELLGNDFGVAPDDAVSRLRALLTTWRAGTAKPLFLGLVQAPPGAHRLAFDKHVGHGAARAALMRGVVELAHQLQDVHLLELDADSLGVAPWFDATGHLATRSVFAHRALPAVARVLARHLACLFRPRRKVLVLDLDNTLWGGVVGEDGVDGLALGQDYPGNAYLGLQRLALDLRGTGVLLALASKNNEADALAVFEQRPEMLLQPAHFSARRINWTDKPANLVAIAQELGLGLDALVFADDSAIECALVREALPQVEVVELGKDPARFVDRVLRTQAFDALHVSGEDRQRADSYAAEAHRHELRATVTDMASFLADCQLRLALQPAIPSTLDRMHQLLGKTNQFNFSLQRPGKDSLQGLMEQGQRLYSASLADRFGDYGLIGVLQLAQDGRVFRIENLVLSCRALGRGVEDAMLAHAHSLARAAGCTRLAVRAVRGPRNQQVLEYLDNAGFVRISDSDGGVEFEIATAPDGLPWPSFVTVQLHEPEGV
jgi:FkbH-like protein